MVLKWPIDLFGIFEMAKPPDLFGRFEMAKGFKMASNISITLQVV